MRIQFYPQEGSIVGSKYVITNVNRRSARNVPILCEEKIIKLDFLVLILRPLLQHQFNTLTASFLILDKSKSIHLPALSMVVSSA